jgi:hypothetical protein
VPVRHLPQESAGRFVTTTVEIEGREEIADAVRDTVDQCVPRYAVFNGLGGASAGGHLKA